jgi:branched-chain amino acid transport system ATP-binding protein
MALAPLLEGHELSKRFGSFQVLKSVSVGVAPGETLGVVGPNGAGKTTLFGVLAGALAPTSGKVILQGSDVTTAGAARRCRLGVARTHQVPRPFLGMSVYENVLAAAAFGGNLADRAAHREAAEALQRSGLAADSDRPAASLGLLDRKRLELARALATRPGIILLDEIGGGLTEAELDILVGLVRELKQDGMAIIWIEHIMHALLRVIDRLICMAEGEIIAEGEPRAVMADKAVMKAYLGGVE